jgi:hypothetical protein
MKTARPHPLITHFLLFVWCVLATGCARIVVSQQSVPGVDVSGIRSYAWHEPAIRIPGDPRLDGANLDPQIRSALEKALAENGLNKAAAGQAPQALLGYTVSIRRKSVSTPVNETAGYNTGWTANRADEGYRSIDSGGTYLEEWEQGRLIVELLGPANGDLLWRGTAKTEINFDNPPSERARRLRTAAKRLIGQIGAGR